MTPYQNDKAMSKTILPEVAADEAINYEEAINQMLAEMKRANEKMVRDQEEIDRLKVRYAKF